MGRFPGLICREVLDGAGRAQNCKHTFRCVGYAEAGVLDAAPLGPVLQPKYMAPAALPQP